MEPSTVTKVEVGPLRLIEGWPGQRDLDLCQEVEGNQYEVAFRLFAVGNVLEYRLHESRLLLQEGVQV